ncbi:MAG: hypothetical protein J5986_03135, partial [Roseburia sp.]|nr:hypothetical protein [Roseburia sp.]
KNGSKELISLLQYMKDTRLENPEIQVRDKRIVELDKIVSEVKKSEEWEAVQMNILEVGINRGMAQGLSKGIEQGISKGEMQKLVSLVCKKLAKGNSVAEIADMLEEEPEVIQKICNIAVSYAPDYDISEITKELMK